MVHNFGTTPSVCEPTRDLVPLAPLLVAGRIRAYVVVNALGEVHEVIVARERRDERSSALLQFRPGPSRATESSSRAVRRQVAPQLIPTAGSG